MSVSTSKQMFINMSPKDIPYYDQRKPFWEQSNDTIQFFLAELDKITNGITIGGYKMHGWEYFHLNFFKNPIPQKTGSDIIMNPPLDDNTFFVMECYKQAERERLGLCLWGTRGFAKSTFIASLKQWTVLTKGGTSMLIVKEKSNLEAIQKLITKSMSNVHPAFKVDMIRADWDSDIDFGLKYKNEEEIILSTIAVRNAEAGKGKASEKGVGLTPTGYVMDEIGTFSPKDILLGALPSLYSEYGARCTYLLCGTGGNSSLSEGAKEILLNPKDYKLAIMNWDNLNNLVPEEHITWKQDTGKQFAMFVPGQFSYRNEIERAEKKFSDFLGLKGDKSELSEMKIRVVDWDVATPELVQRVKDKTTDLARIKQRMYFPLCIDDSFLEDKSNIFDIERAKQKQLEIKKNPKYQAVTLARDETSGKFLRNFSDAPIAGREHTGKPINSPILIYGTFPETIPQIHRYVSSLDDYKQDKAETKSLGAFYVLERRMLDIDKPFETIKLSYASRPERHTDFWKNCEKGISAFNALCCMESADVGFVSYLEDTLKVNAYDYLTPAFSPGNEKVSKNRQTNSRFGIYPTPQNKQYLINLVLEYTNEQQIVGYDDTGKPIIKTGMDYIEDYWLLQEMIDYNPDANVDRIVAFGHALAWARRLDREGIRPKDDFTEKFKDQNNRNRAKIKMQNFSKVRYKNF